MISEPKAFASLSAGLLARKGAARPAMRRQPLGGMGHAMPSGAAVLQDDLGWDDMGYDVDPDVGNMDRAVDLKPLLAGSVMASGEAEDVPEVRRQQAELARRISSDELSATLSKAKTRNTKIVNDKPVTAARRKKISEQAYVPVAAVRAKDKAAFTLRLDPERHLALRLASAVSNQSSQAIMTGLLDDYLASVPEIGELAGRVPAMPPVRKRAAR